jgi:PAS domain S-box-containing protein
MTSPEEALPEEVLAAEALKQAQPRQINDLFDSSELTRAIDTQDFHHFLDHVPIAIAVSKRLRGDPRIVYVNKAYEALIGQALKDVRGRGWSILETLSHEDDPGLTLAKALLKSEESLGAFHRVTPKVVLVEAYSSLIENDDGTENYRIVALIDVTERARAQREAFGRRLHDKEVLLSELQHRIKNNLQLVTAMIRLEAGAHREGDNVNLEKLAGRIESLQLLYRDLAADGLGQSVDLGHYLSQIAAAVMHTYAVGGIRLDLKVDHAPVSVNVATPVGLVVNELLTNAFKYAFNGRGAGTITLRCLHENGLSYRIVVADDGLGMPEGTQWPAPGNLGALIVQTLRENTQNAAVLVDSAPAGGTRVTIGFTHKPPLPKAS